MGDEQLIDQIVRSILEQFQRGENVARIVPASGGRASAAGWSPPGANNNSVQASTEEIKTFTLEAPVITGDVLQQHINGATRITIAQHAILTPSARDLIRQRGITIHRQTATATQSAIGNRWTAIVTKTTPALQIALDDAIQSPGAIVSRELVGTIDEAVQTAVSLICRADADGAIIFSEHPQRAACLANRNRRIRAAMANDAGSVKSVTAAMGANLLCINPVDLPFFGLRNILRQLSAGGPPQVPQNWPE